MGLNRVKLSRFADGRHAFFRIIYCYSRLAEFPHCGVREQNCFMWGYKPLITAACGVIRIVSVSSNVAGGTSLISVSVLPSKCSAGIRYTFQSFSAFPGSFPLSRLASLIKCHKGVYIGTNNSSPCHRPLNISYHLPCIFPSNQSLISFKGVFA